MTDAGFAERLSRLGSESAFQVLSRAKALEAEGRSVIHFEIGEPDFDTPRPRATFPSGKQSRIMRRNSKG